MYLDQTKSFQLGTLLILASLYFLSCLEKKPPYLGKVLPITLFLSLLSIWEAIIPAIMILLFVFMNRDNEGYDKVWLRCLVAIISSFCINLSVVFFLGGSLSLYLKQVLLYMSIKPFSISIWAWLYNQLTYLEYNFTVVNIVLFLALLAYTLGTKKLTKNPLMFTGFVFFCTSFIYLVFFKGISFTVPTIQVYFGASYIFLAGGALCYLQKRVLGGRSIEFLGLCLIVPVIMFTMLTSYRTFENTRSVGFGTPKDIEMIKTLGKRLVYMDVLSGPSQWWESPNIRLYTYDHNPLRKGVVKFKDMMNFDKQGDLLVFLNTAYTEKYLHFFKEKHSISETPKVIAKSPTFIFYSLQ